MADRGTIESQMGGSRVERQRSHGWHKRPIKDMEAGYSTCSRSPTPNI